MPIKSDEHVFGDDQPKKNPWLEDQLGYAPFAERLAKVIIDMSVPNGYVIGLHGRWGSGKTTVINFLLAFINKHNQETEHGARKVEHIDFSPWIVSGHQDLIAAFFKILSEHLGPKEGKLERLMRLASGAAEPLADTAAKLALAVDPGGLVSGLVSGIGKKSLGWALANYRKTPSLQSIYEDLKEQLEGSGRRFLVTIDDLDRLEDHEIKAIMQMVKTIGRLPNVVYVLAYDREIVWKALGEDTDPNGPKFAEKIVQQEVELPVPSKNSLLAILDQEIGFLDDEIENSGRWQYVIQDGVQRWVTSARDVHRFSNALKFAWPSLKGEFDPQDLVAIEGMRLFDPEAFDWIRNNRDFLFSDGRYQVGADELRKTDVQVLKEKLPRAKAAIVLELLTVLFPSHGKWFQGDNFVPRENRNVAQIRRGLSTEAGYDSYFALRPSVDAVPKSVVDQIIDSLEDEAKVTQALNAYISEYNSRGRSMIALLLNDLRTRLVELPSPGPTPALLNALLEVGDEVLGIPWKGEFLRLTPGGELRSLVRAVLEAWGKDKADENLIMAFKHCDSPVVLADIYVDRARELGVFPTDSPATPVVSVETLEKLGAILLPKILEAVEDRSLEEAPFYWDVARSWSYLGDAAACKDWLRRGIQQSGHFTAKVAMGLVKTSVSSSGSHYTFDNSPDEGLYEIDVLHDNAKRHLAEANDLSDDERSLLQAIVTGVDRIQAGKSPDPFDEAG